MCIRDRSIRWIESAVNDYLNDLLKTNNEDYVVASDTDSIYVVFDKLVDMVFKKEQQPSKVISFLDSVARDKIEPFINKS